MKNNVRIIFVAVLLSFVAVTYWRTRHLGFYSDDWILLTKTPISTITFFDYLSANHFTRPIYALVAWIESIIGQGSPIYWQVISSITILICGISVFKALELTYLKSGYNLNSSRWGAFIGVLVMLVSPRALGVWVWSTGVITLWSLTFICFGYVEIHSEKNWKKYLGILLILAGFLVYEAYWFLFVPLLLLALEKNKKKLGDLFKYAMLFTLPLLSALLYQRMLVPMFFGTHSKPISAGSISLIVSNLHILKAIFNILFAVSVLALVARIINFKRFSLVLLCSLLGLIATAIVYALVGYDMTKNGVMSRTMSAPSLYLAIAIGAFVSAAMEKAQLRSKHSATSAIYLTIIALLILVMQYQFIINLTQWVKVKDQSGNVLDSISTNLIKFYPNVSAQENLVIVIQIDGGYDGSIFGASYEISGAVASVKPEFVRGGKTWFLVARERYWGTIWDGSNVIQHACESSNGAVLERKPSLNEPLYLRIDPDNGRLLEVKHLDKNIEIGCEKI